MSGFKVSGAVITVQDWSRGFRVYGSVRGVRGGVLYKSVDLRVQGSGFRVQGSAISVQCSGIGVCRIGGVACPAASVPGVVDPDELLACLQLCDPEYCVAALRPDPVVEPTRTTEVMRTNIF